MAPSKYETIAGQVSRADTYSKLLDLLAQSADQAYVMAHLHALQDTPAENLISTGWKAIGQLIEEVRRRVTKLATSRGTQ